MNRFRRPLRLQCGDWIGKRDRSGWRKVRRLFVVCVRNDFYLN